MGAHHSTQSFTADCSAVAASPDDGPGSADPRLMSSRNASSPIVPPAPMPQLMRPETFEEKLYRKVCVCNANHFFIVELFLPRGAGHNALPVRMVD
jgi:hypothetical protein